MSESTASGPQGRVSVSLTGADGVSVEIYGPEEKAGEVLQKAAAVLGVELDLRRLSIVKNGTQVTPDAPVADGDRLSAAARVANG